MTLLHLGPLHAVEWVMFLALLLGPVAALAATILVVRRRDEREHQEPHLPSPRTPSGRS